MVRLTKQPGYKLKKILIPFLSLLIAGCSSPEPPVNTAKPKSSKPKTAIVKPALNQWIVKNYTDAGGVPSGRKYARFDADGSFSNPTVSQNYLHSVFLLNKENAGILLSLYKKSNPSEKFSGPVTIKLKNSAGSELEMISSRGWNKAGGIMIEQNNNDYSQFRIFMLQSEGVVNVEILDDSASVYKFDLVATGFSDSLNQL